MVTKKSPRRLATQEKITQAFLELVEEVGFKKVTVSLLIKRCQINRSTFYDYYLDKFDLLEQIEDLLIDQLHVILQEDYQQVLHTDSVNLDFLTKHTQRIIDFIYQHKGTISLLLDSENTSHFTEKFKNLIMKHWQTEEVAKKIKIPENYLLSAISSLLIGLIKEWIHSNCRDSKEELINHFQLLTQPIIKSVLL